MLLPYATTSPWMFWKTRVFDFRSAAHEPKGFYAFERGCYQPFDPPDHVYPIHCEKAGVDRFFDYYKASQAERLTQLASLLESLDMAIPETPEAWDIFGDFVQQKIETVLPQDADVNQVQSLFRKQAVELIMRPLWHSIMADTSIALAAQLESLLASRKPLWETDYLPLTTVTSSNLPILRIEEQQTASSDDDREDLSELEKQLTQHILKDPSLADDPSRFDGMASRIAQDLNINLPEDLPDPRELYLQATGQKGLIISPLHEMELFFYTSLKRKFDPEPNSFNTPFSLGDMLRPGLSWPWSYHPGW